MKTFDIRYENGWFFPLLQKCLESRQREKMKNKKLTFSGRVKSKPKIFKI